MSNRSALARVREELLLEELIGRHGALDLTRPALGEAIAGDRLLRIGQAAEAGHKLDGVGDPLVLHVVR